MFSALKPVIYVQISPERLALKNVKTGQTIDDTPDVAIKGSPRREIIAVGSQARQAAALQGAEIVNPFAHPRSLISDFDVAEQLLMHQLHRLLGNHLFIMPCVVMHPLGSPAGGFTQIELKAFREMALGAGASEVFLCNGRPLTDQEVLTRQPADGRWLDA